jgi:hypothetical protein
MVLCSQSQVPLVIDWSQTNPYRLQFMRGSSRYKVSGKSRRVKKRYRRQSTSIYEQCLLHYTSMVTKLTDVADRGGWLPYVDFQENPLNGRIDTSEKVLFLFKQSALNYSSCATKHTTVVGHRSWTEDVVFQENPLNTRRDTADKVPCTVSKVLCIINLQVL